MRNNEVHEGFIKFTNHFKYLESFISFSLQDDFDTKALLASTNSAMGALQDIIRYEHVNIHRKYVIFLSIPINLLLWGCKIWALYKNLLSSLEVFLTQIIWSIMGIRMDQVRYFRIENKSVCDHFYHIPTI